MSFESVSERLTILQDANAELKRSIERLATINFQPGSVPLDNEEGNVLDEMQADIQGLIKEQEEELENLQEDVFDLNPGREGSDLEKRRNVLDRAVKRAIVELHSYQIAFRKAQLAARRTLREAQAEERRLLLISYSAEASTTEPAPVHNRRSQKSADYTSEDKEVNASSDVTAALRRTHAMMAQELSKSQFAHDTLKESTAALERLGENYSTLDTMLSSSRNILGTLMRSQKSDTWYLETSFYLLCATIGWLLWRRLLYGPTWWLVWFPMKIFVRSLMGVLTGVGVIGGSTSSVAAVPSAVPSLVPTEPVVTHRSAPGKLSMPSGAQGPPTVRVGGGGRGAPMSGPNTPPEPSRPLPDSYVEKVGKIIDDSTEGYVDPGVDDDLAAEDVEKNPKKRMWEEEKEAVNHAQRNKDEL